jgi:tetratricopeptide (TPR) repeat protein
MRRRSRHALGVVLLAFGLTEATAQPADTRLTEASTALYAGDSDRALQLATAHLKQYPNAVKGRVLAARAHVARGEYAHAYDQLRAALRVDPRNVDVLYYLGVVTSELATAEFSRLYGLAPEGARAHQLMAESLRLQEKLTEAAAEYELALRASPNLHDALIALGDIRREQSNCDEAVALYRRAQAVRRSYEAAYGLGVCFTIDNQLARAVEQYREALKHDPGSAAGHFALGSALLQMGDAASAVHELERAVALEPRMRQGFYLLGRAYGVLGLRDRSRLAFAKADALAQAERSGTRKALGVVRQ